MDDDDAKIDYEENSIIVVPNCNICNHEFRPQIDEMLALGTSYKHVLEVLGSDGVGLSTKSLSNHKRKHLAPRIVPEVVPAAVQASLINARNRVDQLTFDNNRLRAEAFMSDQKMRMTNQAAVCMTVIDQLLNILETATVKDVLAANKQLSEIMGDRVERKEVQVDIVADLGLGEEVLKDIGDIVAKTTKKAIADNMKHG